jgi:ABC-type branched-subunit amino acid transport system ATPase component
MTVRQNLRVASLAADRRHAALDRHAEIERVLVESALADKAERLSSEITLLDRKRLGLARAMIVRPTLLLLDEVAAGLTHAEVEELVTLIAGLRSAGIAIVIVEHVDNVIGRLADRVIVLDWGRIVAEGTPSEIAANERVREIYLGKQSEAATRPRTVVAEGARTRAGTPLLELRGVSARYNGPPALTDLSFTVNDGEIVAVLGANGSGKTTLARLITGVLAPVAGSVNFAGTDISLIAPHLRANLGIAASPEGRRVFAELTVDENLDLGSYPKHARAQAAQNKAWIYELFPVLLERAKRFGNELSGGQQQMLAIGRALMASPRLLVLDEASLGLAPIVIDAIYEAIAKIRERGVTIVLIEQAAYRAMAIADYVYVLDHGLQTFAGAPDELRNEAVLARAYFGAA